MSIFFENRSIIAMKFSVIACVLAFLGLFKVEANVIGIDFASDALKVAIVQPGTPLEIGT